MITKTIRLSSCSPHFFQRGLRALLCAAAAFFLGSVACRAAASGVMDGGGFFSEQAKADAGRIIAEADRTLHKDIFIETFREIPADVKAGVNLQDKAAASRMYEQWAKKQFKQRGVNGVYVLLVKEPAHLQTDIGNDTQRQAFTLKDRDALVATMIARLQAKQNDDALRDGVNFIFATMKSRVPSRTHTGAATSQPAQQSGGSGWIIQAIIIGVVVWVGIGLIRAIFGRMGGGSAMGQPGYGGGGGGFLSSLVGGMFGAAAGMWMYDQFFSHHGGTSAYGADRNDLGSGDGGFTGQDTDSTSSGSDFGGDSGGGDSGGGDWGGGGGDFGGGGDSGGGGDF